MTLAIQAVCVSNLSDLLFTGLRRGTTSRNGQMSPFQSLGDRNIPAVTVTGTRIMQAESTAQLLSEIQSLSDLHSQLQLLRHIPRILLKLPAFASLVPPSTPTLRSQFQQLNEIAQILRSHPVQHALRSAHDSFANDTSELAPSARRDDRKRRFVNSLSPLQSKHHQQACARSRISSAILPSGTKEIPHVPSR